MRAYDIIFKKRNNQKLSKEEIDFLVFRYGNGDCQIIKCQRF
jgi:thymidine phosphorylase